ncbi:hypothetical protein [Flavobacterium sp. LM4]|uniref:hypothetical protein n=1 Tax=Flavobacterium sp. LM4 TaxID=1938609 RepID=UPI0009929E6E|nr:hypothetical protein [Flavobacterium sp. LM4]OOV18603.1 hypothetical protein BXU10_02560 [Flavobacterium sp. LM4]
MTEFLKKIKLIDNLIIELPININDLVKKIENFVDEDNYDILEGFRSTKKIFKGKIDNKGFKICRKLGGSNNTKVNTIAYGKFKELNAKTKIEIEIIGFDSFFKFFYCFLILFWGVMIFALILFLKNGNQNQSEFGMPIMFMLLSLITILPYFQMKRSIERMKYDLEREFYYLTKE